MSEDTSAVVVKLTAGMVRGRFRDGVASFLGVPYAAAPEGDLRFRAPHPPAAWDGVREAAAFGPAAPQSAPAPGAPPAWAPEHGLDCLSVNVWSPDPTGGPLPVMIWIHGGMWTHGAARMPQYDGANLARAGVVVVTLNYRLGFEGFGHLPGAPDNRGLLDQCAALTWVAENISAFGGDPSDVTVFGQSAGAASIVHLMSAPRARGLFRRAIAQSIPAGLVTVDEARAVTRSIARALDVPATQKGFAEVAPEVLVRAQGAAAAPRGGPTAFGPVLDGDLVTGEPGAALVSGSGARIELLCGFTHDEWAGLGMGHRLPKDVPLAPVVESVGLPSSASDAYRAAYPGQPDSQLASTVLSDALIRIPTLRVAEAHSRAGGTAWLYDLRWKSPGLGAGHCVDIPLVFGHADTRYAQRFLGAQAPADFHPLSGAMREAWTSFATTGDPGWRPYNGSRHARVWDSEPYDVDDPIRASRVLWDQAAVPSSAEGPARPSTEGRAHP